jgi:GNAT superfamily N-acetyltransferase
MDKKNKAPIYLSTTAMTDMFSMRKISSAVKLLDAPIEGVDVHMVWEPTQDHWIQFMDIIEQEKWGSYSPDQFQMIRTFAKQRTVVAVHKEQVLGGIIYVIQPELAQTYISYYVVAKEWRKHGIANKLWDAVLSKEDPRVTGRMLAVDTWGINTSLFRKNRGFNFDGPKILRLLGLNHLVRDITREYLQETSDEHHDCDMGILKINPGSLPKEFLAYDRQISGRPRKDFYDAYCDLPTFKGWYAVHSGHTSDKENTEHNHPDKGKCLGFCFTSHASKAVRVGPLYAENMSIALRLLAEATKDIPLSSQLLFHLPANNDLFLHFLEARAVFSINFVIDRSYTHEYFDKCNFKKIFSFTSHVCQSDC